jgi:hypothetical protein
MLQVLYAQVQLFKLIKLKKYPAAHEGFRQLCTYSAQIRRTPGPAPPHVTPVANPTGSTPAVSVGPTPDVPAAAPVGSMTAAHKLAPVIVDRTE